MTKQLSRHESHDLNGNPLSMPIRILRAAGLSTIGLVFLFSTLVGSDTNLEKMQYTFGIIGALAGVLMMRLARWEQASSPVRSLAFFWIVGSIVGNIVASALSGGWSMPDSIVYGLGLGLAQGAITCLGVIAIRSAAMTFSK